MIKKIRAALCIAAMTLIMLAAAVPASAAGTYGVIIADIDDCLTDAEEAELEKIMQSTANKISCNVGLCITDDLFGMSDERFSDQFSDESFGVGSDSIVLLMVNTHGKPELQYATDEISTSGAARQKYDKYISNIFNSVYRGLDNPFASSGVESRKNVYKNYSSAQYFAAGKGFCSALEALDNPFVKFFALFGDFIADHIGILIAAMVIGLIAALITVSAKKSGYSKKKPITAAKYIDRRETKIKRQSDRFLREYTTSYRVSSSSSSGGHRSGGGGGHHSGGHGGGGGRHR